MDWSEFAAIFVRHARAEAGLVGGVSPGTILFGDGLNLSSVAFLESILEIEEETGQEIDMEGLDPGIRTAGQLFTRLFPTEPLPTGPLASGQNP